MGIFLCQSLGVITGTLHHQAVVFDITSFVIRQVRTEAASEAIKGESTFNSLLTYSHFKNNSYFRFVNDFVSV